MMRRYKIVLSEDRLFTAIHDRRYDITYKLNNMTDAWGLIGPEVYHIRNLLRLGWFQRRKRLL